MSRAMDNLPTESDLFWENFTLEELNNPKGTQNLINRIEKCMPNNLLDQMIIQGNLKAVLKYLSCNHDQEALQSLCQVAHMCLEWIYTNNFFNLLDDEIHMHHNTLEEHECESWACPYCHVKERLKGQIKLKHRLNKQELSTKLNRHLDILIIEANISPKLNNTTFRALGHEILNQLKKIDPNHEVCTQPKIQEKVAQGLKLHEKHELCETCIFLVRLESLTNDAHQQQIAKT
jgi:hypothetical protein